MIRTPGAAVAAADLLCVVHRHRKRRKCRANQDPCRFCDRDIVATSKDQEAAKALIRFLSSPVARETWKSKGFDAP